MSNATVCAPRDIREWVESLAFGSGHLIDGRSTSTNGVTFRVIDPATATTITEVVDGTSADAIAAVDAAARALPGWADTSPRERSEVLHRAFALMLASAEDLAALVAWENGKSLNDARSEVIYAAEFFRWFAEEAVRTEGQYGSSPAGRTRTVITHRPVGVAALVTPWNFPAAMPCVSG